MKRSRPEGSGVAIFGAGPAGLMAAEVLSAAGCAVTLYERMPSPARKFLLAGRGGLNLTHSEPVERFTARYREAAPALASALRALRPDDLRHWAEGLGEPTFVGSSGRVFPKSFKASPLLRAWLRRLALQGVQLKARHRFEGFGDNGAIRVRDDQGYPALIDPVASLLALGGASWPRLGADGGWVSALRMGGVGVASLQPANAGIEIAWSSMFSARFAGAPLKRIALTFGREVVRGEALITEKGLEGGAVYALSSALRRALAKAAPQSLTIDLRPDLDLDGLQARLALPHAGQSLSNRLRKQAALTPAAIGLLREAFRNLLPTEPAGLASAIKQVPIRVAALMPIERAISSAGGILLNEIDDHFMLKKHPGVFVAGEMLDWEAPTGGYLLQACFSTGAAAARGMLTHIDGADAPQSAFQ